MSDISGADPASDDREQLREIAEARDACEQAMGALTEAQRKVDSARSWGTYDTWFGGGLFSSLVKHDRIDEAEQYMHAVDAALDRLRRELADVSMGDVALGNVGVGGLTRTLDVWFDNFFTDISVQGRLKEADERLDAIGEALYAVRRELVKRHDEVSARLHQP